MSPDYLLGEVTQSSDSELSETDTLVAVPDYLRGPHEGPSRGDGEELWSQTGATGDYSEGTHRRHAAHQDGDHEDTGGWDKVDRRMGQGQKVGGTRSTGG